MTGYIGEVKRLEKDLVGGAEIVFGIGVLYPRAHVSFDLSQTASVLHNSYGSFNLRLCNSDSNVDCR